MDSLGNSKQLGKNERYSVIIDAGIENIRFQVDEVANGTKTRVCDIVFSNDDNLKSLFEASGVFDLIKSFEDDHKEYDVLITGKLADIVSHAFNRGKKIFPIASLWQAASTLLKKNENKEVDSLGIIELSASGYTILALDREGKLKDDLLIVNPNCGAGSGVNMKRILQKLNIPPEEVDIILREYLGEEGRAKRESVPIRADRCGVFSSSATISDKNQGLPIDYALAATLKSEVMKACKKMNTVVPKVYLTGGMFRWKFAQDCAKDYLKKLGVKEVVFDDKNEIPFIGVKGLTDELSSGGFKKDHESIRKPEILETYPSFKGLKSRYQKEGLFKRLPEDKDFNLSPEIENIPIIVALDVGSTMAKIAISDAKTGETLYLDSFENHGDTVETIKHIFGVLKDHGIKNLSIQNVGITGSGRYQVQKVLKELYPHLEKRISVLVENHAHARGSIEEAKQRIEELKEKGEKVNEDYVVLVDVGGEDTKISVVSLKNGDLYDNAMNIKCSAGTGSLMDTLKSMFGIQNIKAACERAFNADKAYNINATCAVFLMENATKMRAEGIDQNEILASCYWAITENMARTLWSQIEFPKNALALLHGQTMLSDPLPIAVTHRLQEFTGSKTFGLVPDYPGHRACMGLVKSIIRDNKEKRRKTIKTKCDISTLIDSNFEKKIIVCRGAVCGDKDARCNRVRLSYQTKDGKNQGVNLGGCSAINEIAARRTDSTSEAPKAENQDVYRELWEEQESFLPKSDDPRRLVIPRMFAVSEQSFLIGTILKNLGLPVHVDNSKMEDVQVGQKHFNIDACAPNIGATGQMIRIANEAHGMILVPQIDFLPTGKTSLGRTCTVNQSGGIVAMHYAKQENPDAKFHIFDLSLDKIDPEYLAMQLLKKLQPVFKFYGKEISENDIVDAIKEALQVQEKLKENIAEKVAESIERAIKENKDVVIVCGREYVLNPGIYDSHIGKLFKDKGVVSIPSHIFDIDLNENLKHLYWKNPHHILSVIDAVKNKSLHKIVKNERLRKILETIETGQTDSQIGLSYVSTFSCGPDTVTMPLIAEITKNIPFVLVQSDGAIQELAHLENRVNTYLKQLTARAKEELKTDDFQIEVLEAFATDKLNKETDVIYVPTLSDNRTMTSVFRAAGFTCIDNFSDENFDLQKTIKHGRKYIGDAVCAPLAAVFADTANAVNDFIERKKRGQLKEKKRVFVFNNKGAGPCRQGQYYEVHRLFLHRELRNIVGDKFPEIESLDDFVVKFLVAHESKQFDVGVQEWALIQAFQGVILQGVLHQVFIKGASACKDNEEYEEFLKAFRQQKEELYQIQESWKPKWLGEKLPKLMAGVDQVLFDIQSKVVDVLKLKAKPKKTNLGGIAKFFGYGLHNNTGLRGALKSFTDKWTTGRKEKKEDVKLKIHADGEAYMRGAQIEEIFKSLTDILGHGSFDLTYSPIWTYLEYMPVSRMMILEQDKENLIELLKFKSDSQEKEKIQKEIKEKEIGINNFREVIKNLRTRLAEPLYKAAGLEVPEPMEEIVESGKRFLPTGKPYGELLPYIGEVYRKLKSGTDLFLNIAPSGCMVGTVGELMHPAVLQTLGDTNAHTQTLLSRDGEVDDDALELALLKALGPVKFYSRQ